MPNYNVPESAKNNFTDDEVQEYVSQFKALDADGNGTLDASEMTALMKNLGLKDASNPEYVKKLMDEIDEDGDGVINLKEFFGMMNIGTSALRKGLAKKITDENNAQIAKKKILKRKQSITERMFKKSNKNKAVTQIQAKNLTERGGTLDRSEIHGILVTLGYQLDGDQQEALFDRIDKNGDGEIQFDEFLPWYMKHRQSRRIKKTKVLLLLHLMTATFQLLTVK